MALSDDFDTDRDTVFLNTAEFAETVAYRVASSGATFSITAEIEDEGDTILTDGLRARISEDALDAQGAAPPVKGDQIIRSGTFTATFVTLEMGVYVLECEREELVT